MVPPDSHGISRAPCYLGSHTGGAVVVVYGGLTLCAGPFAWPSTTLEISYSAPERQYRPNDPTTPNTQRLPAITRARFSLFRFRSPLLTESRLLSLPVGTEMFHFPTFPPLALCVQARVTGHDSCRVSPFGNPRITARLAAPRGLSQPPTSFIGSWCQGIHRAPLLTWPQRCSRPLCSSQGAGGPGRVLVACSAAAERFDARRSIRGRTPCRPEPNGVRATESGSCDVRTARSLRTQQRAWAASAPRPVPTGGPAVLGMSRAATAYWSVFHP